MSVFVLWGVWEGGREARQEDLGLWSLKTSLPVLCGLRQLP